MDLKLNDKNAVVCGSTQGIGKAVAIELALLGANILLVARNETSLKEVEGELDTSQNQQHDFLVADFSEASSLKEKIESKVNNGFTAEILVNNTGGPKAGQAIDAPLEEYRIAFNNHLICNQILVQALLPGMKSAGYGRIINIISTSVKTPIPLLGVSNTIRGAVASWSKTLANELGQFGITVNNILPGFTQTGRLESLMVSRAEKLNTTREEIKKKMESEIPANRIGKPEELGAVAAFLASPAASYVNGVNIPVDGGRTPSM